MWCKEDLSAGMHRMDSQMTWFEWGAQRLVYSIDTPGLPASALNLQIAGRLHRLSGSRVITDAQIPDPVIHASRDAGRLHQ